MWKFFLKDIKKNDKKKKTVNKVTVKKTRPRTKVVKRKPLKKDETDNPLKILEKTLDNKLKEIGTKKNKKTSEEHTEPAYKEGKEAVKLVAGHTGTDNLQEEHKIEAANNEPATDTIKELYNIKEPVTIKEKPTNIPYKLSASEEALIQFIKDTGDEKTNGLLYGVLVDNLSNKMIFELNGGNYNISFINEFIEQYFQVSGQPKNSEQLIFAQLENNSFLCIQYFPKYYFGLLFNGNEVSFGQILNVIRPELIKKYYQIINA